MLDCILPHWCNFDVCMYVLAGNKGASAISGGLGRNLQRWCYFDVCACGVKGRGEEQAGYWLQFEALVQL